MDENTDEERYKLLLKVESIASIAADDVLEAIGLLIDLSEDLKQIDGLDRAVKWIKEYQRKEISESDQVILQYFLANSWAARRHLKEFEWKTAQASSKEEKEGARGDKPSEGDPWAWEQPERQEEILCLRRAINHPGFDQVDHFRRCQIYTNLANQLNTVGRPVEALEYWERALSIYPTFGMALGNSGYALHSYAYFLYDGGHQSVFALVAHKLLTSSLSKKAFYGSPGEAEAQRFFAGLKQDIESKIDVSKVAKSIKLDGHDMGRSEDERKYRRWCLDNRLFLNPLNDLGKYSIANQDILLLPPYKTENGEPPTLISFYNQIKQEFTSARLFLFEGTHSEEVHFADRGVALYDTYDYSTYSVAIEKIKMAYRMAYSIFDKCAFFLNEYMALGMAQSQVSFRKIWYTNSNKERSKWQLREKLVNAQNTPFRGLFWMSKDLFEEEFVDVTEPDARALNEIRNHLEHKYLKIHELKPPPPNADSSNVNQFAYSIWRSDLETKTLRLLKLARAALIYLSLGMTLEEYRREEKQEGKKVAQIRLGLIDDDSKR